MEWPAALLMLLMLLTAHVRLYTAPALADGWATALRPLVLDLCTHARSARWLFEARVVKREFRTVVGTSDQDARRRLEMMVHVYFTEAQHVVGAPFRPELGRAAPVLVDQLLRFSLHGTMTMPDLELASSLGCVRAHAALAVGNGGRPWG